MIQQENRNDKTKLGLPPELRNNIYRSALVSSGPVNIDSIPAMVRLLHTCHQIRAEPLELFYAENTSQITCADERQTTDVLRWLSSLGERHDTVGLLSNVMIQFQLPTEMNDAINWLKRAHDQQDIESFNKAADRIRELIDPLLDSVKVFTQAISASKVRAECITVEKALVLESYDRSTIDDQKKNVLALVAKHFSTFVEVKKTN